MDSFLDYFVGISSVVISLYIAKKEFSVGHKREIATQQLQNVYLPLFKILEPSLYKSPSKELIQTFLETYDFIVSNHYELIDPNLIDDVRLLRANIDKGNFYRLYETLCSRVERNFEKNRKTLLLPTRTISYKLCNDQYPKETREFITQMATYLGQALFFLFALTMLSFAVEFLTNLFKTILSKF